MSGEDKATGEYFLGVDAEKWHNSTNRFFERAYKAITGSAYVAIFASALMAGTGVYTLLMSRAPEKQVEYSFEDTKRKKRAYIERLIYRGEKYGNAVDELIREHTGSVDDKVGNP